jgi:hypothetical protein
VSLEQVERLNEMRRSLILKGISEDNPVIRGLDAQIQMLLKRWHEGLK